MEITMIEPVETALTLPQRAALALGSSQTEKDLLALATKNAAIVAVIDKAGREQAHGAAMELRTARTTIEKVSKASRDDAVQFGKAVIAEEKRLIQIIQPEETRLISLRDDWDAEQARIKAEAEALERTRVMAITGQINKIMDMPALVATCRTSERMSSFLANLNELYKFDFAEFATEATLSYEVAYKRIQKLVDDKITEEVAAANAKAEREAEAARLELEREQLEKEKAELAAERKAIEDAKPKAPPPADKFQEDLDAFAAAVAPAPVIPAPAPVQTLSGRPYMPPRMPKPTRPSDDEIVAVLAAHFKVGNPTVMGWLINFGAIETV
jgi:hypothetical protein